MTITMIQFIIFLILPWLILSVIIALYSAKANQNRQISDGFYYHFFEWMGLGLCFGIAFGIALGSTITGAAAGVISGLIVGTSERMQKSKVGNKY